MDLPTSYLAPGAAVKFRKYFNVFWRLSVHRAVPTKLNPNFKVKCVMRKGGGGVGWWGERTKIKERRRQGRWKEQGSG